MNFKENGYTLVKNAISKELGDFVTQYALFDEMQNFGGAGDSQIPNSHYKYADPAMESMLIHLQKSMEENTGLSLYPTYSYYRVYRPGDELKMHKDRPSCEISATVCFNFQYENLDYDWPIFMEGNAVSLNPGDMVIYRGCDLSHWRETFVGSDTDWHVQGFFHYVDANGPYADHKFDKRETIGALDANRKKIVSSKSYITSTV
jgi:hypothetical protein